MAAVRLSRVQPPPPEAPSVDASPPPLAVCDPSGTLAASDPPPVPLPVPAPVPVPLPPVALPAPELVAEPPPLFPEPPPPYGLVEGAPGVCEVLFVPHDHTESSSATPRHVRA